MSRIRRVTAGLMSVLCLLATPAFGSDAVVCFASGGHVAIEASPSAGTPSFTRG